ncbi:putative protease Do-like 14 [Apium graveolens]|uniref:putative protease Do-like 14 n=1 Tax=Apium graveolens TaxID=4045 RepID=UPI003D7B6871
MGDQIPNDSAKSEVCYIHKLSVKWPKFSKYDCNEYLDPDTKAAVINASSSVTALISFSGGVKLTRGSGTIIERHDDSIIVLTSTNLIRRSTSRKSRRPTSQEFGRNKLARDITVHAHLCDSEVYRGGEVYAHDFDFNLAIIRFSSIPSSGAAKVAKIASIDDSLILGDRVIVMGRYFAEPFEPMAAPGDYRLKKISYDCKQLFTTNCKITRCGDGGPLINSLGELIGIAFFDPFSTPCLPINIAYKWWDHCKEYGKFCRPFLGFEAMSLFAADIGLIERVIHNFPDAHKGLVVEKIVPDSPAYLAGLRVHDVIVKCDGKPVQSFLELFEILLEKVGVLVELSLIRAGHDTHTQLNIVFVEATSAQFNRWPVHKERVLIRYA